jgi:hypothetical protein
MILVVDSRLKGLFGNYLTHDKDLLY